MNDRIIVRKGTEKDIPAAWQLIHELAVYEYAGDEVKTTPTSMINHGFGDRSYFEFFVAEHENEIVGMALYFFTYSTWKGPCLYLEDLVVTESYRRKGIGQLLFGALIKTAKESGAQRMAWQVLDWNEPAIAFYKKINADLDPTWINCKLTAQQINEY